MTALDRSATVSSMGTLLTILVVWVAANVVLFTGLWLKYILESDKRDPYEQDSYADYRRQEREREDGNQSKPLDPAAWRIWLR